MIHHASKLFVCAASLSLGGCAAVPIATISAAAGAAASAQQFSSAVYRLGKLRAAEYSTVERLREAVLAAADDLELEIRKEQRVDDRRVRFEMFDDENDRIVVLIRRQTPTMSVLTIDVGLFGGQEIARLMYERVTKALEEMPPMESLERNASEE